jgi:hypothetical protein
MEKKGCIKALMTESIKGEKKGKRKTLVIFEQRSDIENMVRVSENF